jgi:ribosomal protein L29
MDQSELCTWTQSIGGSKSIGVTESVGPTLSLTRTGGSQSMGNNSAARTGRGGKSPKHLGGPFQDRRLPCVDEVDSLEKLEPALCTQLVSNRDTHGPSRKAMTTDPLNSDYSDDCVTVPILGAPDDELEDRVKKLKEEAAEFERFQKLREEVAELERLKKLRHEVAQLERQKQMRDDSRPIELDESELRSQGQTRGLIKVPQPPPLPPVGSIGTTKRKTRSEIAAEAVAKELVAKEAEEEKKKTKKSKKNHRVTPLG